MTRGKVYKERQREVGSKERKSSTESSDQSTMGEGGEVKRKEIGSRLGWFERGGATTSVWEGGHPNRLYGLNLTNSDAYGIRNYLGNALDRQTPQPLRFASLSLLDRVFILAFFLERLAHEVYYFFYRKGHFQATPMIIPPMFAILNIARSISWWPFG